MTTRRTSALFLTISPLALLASAPAVAQQNQEAVQEANVGQAAAQGDTPDQSTIVVTGTRRTDRTVADSPVPVDVISAESLGNTGFTEVNRALTQEVPSFNFPQPSITDGTDVIRPATLRGLGPDQTLVLINGKRRHSAALLNINGSVGRGTSAVDINMIPTIALSRVEVLRDGAAAQYGSDAIAGVINFQLRSARQGGKASVTYGKYYTDVQGVQTYNGVQTNADGSPVLTPDGVLTLNYSGDERRRRDGRTVTLAGVVAVPLNAEGQVNFAAEWQDRNPTNRTGADPRRQYNLIGTALDPREQSINRFSHRYGDAGTVDYKFWVNADHPIGAAELYLFGNLNQRNGESAGFFRQPLNGNNIASIYPDGFLPLINTKTEDQAGTVGLRGDASGWRWDVSLQYGRNMTDFFITNTLNRSFGPSSPTQFDSGGLRYGQTLANLDVTRDLALGFASKTSLSLGAEYRREKFDIRAGEIGSYANGSFGGSPGAQVFPGFQPTIAGQRVDQPHSRNNKSLYAEIDSDITDAVNIQGALRYEDYSDFGSDLNWKLAGRFEPVNGIAVRASASTGFRAPSLQQQFFAAASTQNVSGVLLDTVTLPVNNPAAQALGAKELKAEQSQSYSAGLVFSAIPRLNVTIDIYQVKIDDRIVVTENLGAFGSAAQNAAVRQVLTAAGFPTVTAARFFLNGVDTRTRGLDFVTTYRIADFIGGRLNLTGGFNYNKTKITRNAANQGSVSTIPGLILFGRQESLRLEQGQPRTKINASLDFDRQWFGATLRATRYGKVLAAGADRFNDVNLDAKTITDLELRFKPLGDRLSLALGGNNIFDVYPTKLLTGRGIDPDTGLARNYSANNYFLPFSSFSPFGFNGRYLYGRASIDF
ncbi:TonB-dependent receptor plug domain-containing protein [Sphingomonas glaciei]|uniref:TonB-dependent receptor n=1 Tax=Sphingomonas glaciei TaxID=2938948 RepID=A0ABY5MQG9_9SPHN|nr:TonB-dependent receptor [Sphingomonas glaciei]UUR06755.1 TonB-dependent receptor [Sphingomonas glaciei]